MTSIVHRGYALIAIVIVFMGLLIVVGGPNTLARAEDASDFSATPVASRVIPTPTQEYEGCEFRVSSPGSETELFAPQLCWLDLSQIDNPWDGPQLVRQKIGDLTLEFNAEIVAGSSYLMDVTSEVISGDDKSIFGYDRDGMVNFGLSTEAGRNEQLTSDRLELSKAGAKVKRPVLRAYLKHTFGGEGKKYAVVRLSDIRVIGRDNRELKKYDLVVMDAERTTTRSNSYHEAITLQADSRGKILQPLLLYNDDGRTCKWASTLNFTFEGRNAWGSRAAANWEVDGKTFDYACLVDYTVTQPGAFLTSIQNPTSLEIGLYTSSTSGGKQGVAIALNVGRIGGHVDADTSAETKILGNQTVFDFEAGSTKDEFEAVVNSSTDQPARQDAAPFATLLRSVRYEGGIPRASDPYTFRSQARTPDGTNVFDRYDPEWTCQLGNRKLQKGNFPAGFVVTNGDNTSTVTYANAENEPVYCAVKWKPKFNRASLTVEKRIDGLDPHTDRAYNFRYQCTPPPGFDKAFGNQQLDGDFVLGQGGDRTLTHQIDGLVEGATCHVSEDLSTDDVPDGYKHTLTWNPEQQAGTSPSLTLRAEDDSANRIVAINTYERKLTALNVTKKLGGSAAATLVAPGQQRQVNFGLTCEGVDERIVAVELRNENGTVTTTKATRVPGLPAGSMCTLSPKFKVDNPDIVLRHRYIVLDGKNIEQNQSGDYIFRLKDEDGSVSNLAIDTAYDKTTTVTVTAAAAGPAREVGEVPNRDLSIGYRCVAGQETVLEGRVAAAPGQSVEVKGVPVGSLCALDLDTSYNYPQARLLRDQSTVTIREGRERTIPLLTAEQPVIEIRDTQGQRSPNITVSAWFALRSVPVRIVNIQHGAPQGLEQAEFINRITCNGEDFSSATTLAKATSAADYSAAMAQPPQGGIIVELPAGARCEYQLDGSALQARPDLAVTADDRKPYSQMGLWDYAGVADSRNPRDPLSADTRVDSTMKQPVVKFSTPNTVPSPSNQDVALTLASETFFRTATVTVSFHKEAVGAVSSSQEFQFSSNCEPSDFTLRSGETHLFKDVPVNTTCQVTELIDDHHTIPQAQWEPHDISPRYRIDQGEINQAAMSQGAVTEGPAWTFTVLPVAEAEDTDRHGDKWTVTARNTIPGIALDKRIKGAGLSALTEAVAGTVVLPAQAEAMDITYIVRNRSTIPLEAVTLRDPSLAGAEILADGQTLLISDDGLIPAAACEIETLDAEAEVECSIKVKIPGDPRRFYHYRGSAAEVTAVTTGQENLQQVSDIAGANALRLSAAVAQMLPQTGLQSLVLFLLLGVIILGFGLWRYMRES
ncbi:DUF5979 domain-containing protein [Corynebacterium sp. ES2775-CONJ]|uniref:DUF5979 domain-containing protein n=1 Tax=Corynebacterium sp. ES2775-CONJ TaxID=2974029 RepID=UPI002166D708|nr:DUF5979 domain-containing protein [Corynebacterium sp. ES2775-CONJ]